MSDDLTVERLTECLAASRGTLVDGHGGRLAGADLARQIAGEQAELRRHGARRGSRVGWRAAPNATSLLREAACLDVGAVAVPLPADSCHDVPVRLDLAIDLAVNPTAPRPGRGGQDHDGSLANAKFTSGTTGGRKVVGATSAHLEHTWRGLDGLLGMDSSDLVLAVLEPHVWLQRTLVLLALARGATVVLLDNTRALVAAARRHRPTVVYAVPGVLGAMVGVSAAAQRPLSELWGGQLRSLGTGSAPCAAAVLTAYADAHLPLHEGYGTSETGMIAKNKHGATRLGSVGPAFEGVQIEIVDAAVRVRCDALPADHYLDGSPIPGRTSSVVHNTGDRGIVDDDGYLHLLGRTDDMLVLSSGHKLDPAPLEAMLRAPEVRECALLVTDERLVLAVVPADAAAERKVRSAVQDRFAGLPVAQRPVLIVLGPDDRLPRNATGGLLRDRLAEFLAGCS